MGAGFLCLSLGPGTNVCKSLCKVYVGFRDLFIIGSKRYPIRYGLIVKRKSFPIRSIQICAAAVIISFYNILCVRGCLCGITAGTFAGIIVPDGINTSRTEYLFGAAFL